MFLLFLFLLTKNQFENGNLKVIGPFRVPTDSHIQNEAKCYLHKDTNHFLTNGFALSLTLKQRLEATCKWYIMYCQCYIVSLINCR